jgi:hypothetical protein
MNDKTRDIFRQAITEVFDQYPEDDKEINKMYIPDPFVEVLTKQLINRTLLVTRNAIDNGITDPVQIEKIVKEYFDVK